ncbi:HDOD domain-containing protein [Marinobacterium weihaiense]|uniref:HDOD domain-containing protein n=1 Tax=Marinobacterium weihaiense TaxID=2851016 RepID=UPI0020B8FA0F|nr:HDOD domain-containing protein [Marinobacterium weihaiense]
MSVGVPGLNEERSATARLVLLHDRAGKVLALLPAAALLDLNRLCQLAGRELQPVKAEDTRRFFEQPALATAAGREQLFTLPLLLDEALPASALSCQEPYSGWQCLLSALPAHERVLKGRFGSTPQVPAQVSAGLADETVINRAVERFTSVRVRQRLQDLLGLPGLSESMRTIVQLRSNPDAGVDDLVPVVKRDPSLSAQVMGWASSPYYAAPGKVRSIEDAVIRVLGFDLVINLAVGVAMGKVLSLPEDTPRGSVYYWDQAISTATLCELLARKSSLDERPRPGLAYLAGLLHNFGYLVLGHLFPPHFSRLSRYIEANPHLEQQQVEQEILHVTREQIGGWVLDNWKLPDEVCAAVRFQQVPEQAGEHDTYAQILYLASRLLRVEGLSDGPRVAVPAVLPAQLGLTAEQVEAAVATVKAQAEELAQLSRLFDQAS